MKYVKIFPILAVALSLALLLAALPATPALAQAYLEVTPTKGTIDDRIDVYVTYVDVTTRVDLYFSDEPANVGDRIDTEVEDYELMVRGVYTNVDGELYAYFYVPDELTDGEDPDTKVRAGSYYVYLTYYGSKPIVAADEFTVESLGEITLDPEEGTVGTEVEIAGEGFEDEEDLTVEYDDDEVDIESGDEETDDDGEFEDTIIIIPPSTAGDHTITVIGEDSEIEATAEFTVEPEITLDPTSGPPGTEVTVTGTGFGERSDFEYVEFDGDDIDIESGDEDTDSDGSFEFTFIVIETDLDTYELEVEDEDDNSDKAEFTIVAALPATINLSTTTGYVGTEVTVSGTGFQDSQSISITFDNDLATTTTTDDNGEFTAIFTVPVRSAGTYEIKVSDGTNTEEADFSISTSASISPTTSATSPGHVGIELTVGGVGFTVGRTVTITYDGNQVTTATVNTDGTFSATFKVPASSGGAHTIIATDATNSREFTFVMESTPPTIPVPLKPEMNIKAEAAAYFDWEDVTDPSDVTYTLQIATSEDFVKGSIVLEKTGLTQSEYTITEAEKLQSISKEAPYYWHVKAIDGAFNESQWSGTGAFYVGFSLAMPQPLIYTIFGIGALLLGMFGFWLGRKTAYY